MMKCDPRAKAKCPFKNPCCGDEEAYFLEGSECDKFNHDVLSPPPTNGDRIRSMSDKKLARFLAKVEGRRAANGGGAVWNGAAHALEWLRQPAEEALNDA